MTQDEYILKVENLSKKFDHFYALKNVSLNVGNKDKKVVLLIGPNGCGKTTLINCISGVYKPDGGKVFFKGIDITGKEPYDIVKLGLGRTFQIPQPFKNLTVGENLMVFYPNHPGESFLLSTFKKRWIKCEEEVIQKTFRILKILDLEEQCDRLAGELSGGQLKLLEIGRLLMMESEMMLLDEPIGGINPVLANKILWYIKKIADEFKISFLIVEHRLDIIMPHVDYVYVLSQGTNICDGSPKDIVKREELYNIYI
jgi:branched-chain amino acid transport system ATP-binding protein